VFTYVNNIAIDIGKNHTTNNFITSKRHRMLCKHDGQKNRKQEYTVLTLNSE